MIPYINQQFIHYRLIEARHPYESQLWVDTCQRLTHGLVRLQPKAEIHICYR